MLTKFCVYQFYVIFLSYNTLKKLSQTTQNLVEATITTRKNETKGKSNMKLERNGKFFDALDSG